MYDIQACHPGSSCVLYVDSQNFGGLEFWQCLALTHQTPSPYSLPILSAL